MRAIWSFETSETTHPTTQDHITQDLRNVAVRPLNLTHRRIFMFHKSKCWWKFAATGDDCTWSPGVLYFLLLGNMLDDSDIAQILGSGASPSVATTAAHVAKVHKGRECKIPRVLLLSTVTVTPKLLNNCCSLHRNLLVLWSQRERWRREIHALSWSQIPVTLPVQTSNDMFRVCLKMQRVIQFWITRKDDRVRWIENDLKGRYSGAYRGTRARVCGVHGSVPFWGSSLWFAYKNSLGVIGDRCDDYNTGGTGQECMRYKLDRLVTKTYVS